VQCNYLQTRLLKLADCLRHWQAVRLKIRVILFLAKRFKRCNTLRRPLVVENFVKKEKLVYIRGVRCISLVVVVVNCTTKQHSDYRALGSLLVKKPMQ
jgi:hypothetical protein